MGAGRPDPANTHHGLLLVNNDDRVRDGTGFDTHPHQDMEIVTWVLDGTLEHKDSERNRGVLYPGLAQRMSAGRGIWRAPRCASPVPAPGGPSWRGPQAPRCSCGRRRDRSAVAGLSRATPSTPVRTTISTRPTLTCSSTGSGYPSGRARQGGRRVDTFEVANDVGRYTEAALFQPGTSTETIQRFSTVAGEIGSPDTWGDPRGFSVKFYATEGNDEMVGNNTPT